jgi:outer membrane autotransporter protein
MKHQTKDSPGKEAPRSEAPSTTEVRQRNITLKQSSGFSSNHVLILLAAISLSGVSQTAHSQAPVPWSDLARTSELQQLVERTIADKRIPGASVSIRQGDQRWTTTAGLANVDDGVPPTAGTYFGYRSITKSLVTTVILQLAREGRIGLDDAIGKYVAGVPSGDTMTIRQAAEMRSGLLNYTASPVFAAAFVADPGRVWTGRELLAYAFAAPLRFTPGTSYEYSNSNTVLLGEIIASATGRIWSDEVRRRLSLPFGLTSVIDQGSSAIPAPSAVGYINEGDGPDSLADFNGTGLGASGALIGVIGDLERWGKVLGSGAALSKADFVARLKSLGSTKSDPRSPEYDSYGFGWGEISGWVGHTGNGLGFEALVMYDRATDRTITILFNASNPDDADAPAHLFRDLLTVLGWTEPPNQRQVVANGTHAAVGAGTIWTGLVSGPFAARAAVYAANGGVATADGPVALAPLQDFVPAIFVGRNGQVALDRGGTITAAPGGDGAFLNGSDGTARLSLRDIDINLRGDSVSGTGIDAHDSAKASLANVRISGTALAALHAGGDSAASISGSQMALDLQSGHGAWASRNGTINLVNSVVVLRGEGHGLLATGRDSPATIQTNGVSVLTFGSGSYGALAQGPSAAMRLANTQITTFGVGAHGLVVGDGAFVNLAGSSIRSEGAKAAAVGAFAQAAVPAATSAKVSLFDTTLSAGSGTAIAAAGQDLSVLVSHSQVSGSIVRGPGASIDLMIDRHSTWTLPPIAAAAPSRVTNLVSRNSNIVFSSSPDSGSAQFQSLIVGDYHGEDGDLVVNAGLRQDSAGADRLIIDGGRASGSTRLVVLPGRGSGAATSGDGITLVETRNGGRTDPMAFSLAGGRVAAGAYNYNLARGGASSADDWFLRSTRTSGAPDLRSEVALNLTLPAIAGRFDLTMIGTYHERDSGRIEGDDQGGRAWARVFGEKGSRRSSDSDDYSRLGGFLGGGPSYDIGLAGFQTGVDLFRGNNTVVGLAVGAGRVEADVDAIYGGRAGRATTDAYSMGAYLTHFSPSGWYLDGALQGSFYDDAETVTLLGERMETNGRGLTASLEAGYSIDLGAGWRIEPQSQIIYQHLSFDDGQDRIGRVHYSGVDEVHGRLGARLTRDWDLASDGILTTWLRANLWHTFSADAEATFTNLEGANPVSLTTDLGGTWAQLGLGASARIAANVSLFASADYNVRLDSRQGQGVGGRLGLTVRW